MDTDTDQHATTYEIPTLHSDTVDMLLFARLHFFFKTFFFSSVNFVSFVRIYIYCYYLQVVAARPCKCILTEVSSNSKD